jgi:hypothetical protein
LKIKQESLQEETEGRALLPSFNSKIQGYLRGIKPLPRQQLTGWIPLMPLSMIMIFFLSISSSVLLY